MVSEYDFDELYGSGFLTLDSLDGGTISARVLDVERKELRDMDGTGTIPKLVLHLEGVTELLALNKKNARRLAKALGKHPEKWKGAIIKLAEEENPNGKNGIGVEVIRKPDGAKPPADGDMSDNIPF